MEADLLRYYGLDLWPELTGPRLTWRRLRVLIEQLPPDAAVVRAQLGDKARWDVAEQLLARTCHLLELQLYQAADPKKRGPAPKPIPMPWDGDTPTSAERMAEALRSFRDRHGTTKGE